ncbi:hypothetical protein HPB49_014620 [Dermacentor silvarum]|uniref:Uncharacterized protein n=1 Tax=Dermacentor silvarum TaxID=543639 RepID=A0ACB8CXV8_DERSI|nr:hypothetical protein HPB49_014620 [Dermacentor silvarum]
MLRLLEQRGFRVPATTADESTAIGWFIVLSTLGKNKDGFESTILGICVSIGNTTGILVPYITGVLTETMNTLEQWSYSFYLAGVVGLVTGLFFQLFASAEVQSWGLVETTPDKAPPCANEKTALKTSKQATPSINGATAPATDGKEARTEL